MNDLTFNILKIVIAVSAALITAYLIPYIKNKLKDEKYAQLVAMVETAVRAAEQTFKGSGKGKLKKEDVLSFVHFWMVNNGIDISDAQLDELIEAAVFQLNK